MIAVRIPLQLESGRGCHGGHRRGARIPALRSVVGIMAIDNVPPIVTLGVAVKQRSLVSLGRNRTFLGEPDA